MAEEIVFTKTGGKATPETSGRVQIGRGPQNRLDLGEAELERGREERKVRVGRRGRRAKREQSQNG